MKLLTRTSVWLLASCWLLPLALAQEEPALLFSATTTAFPTGSRLKVHLPQSLKSADPNGYEHRDALFGQPPAGGSIIQPLYYAESDFCTMSLVGGDNAPVQYYPNKPPMGEPFLLMVDRGGGCTFVKKVRNAQHMGASGVLIADNVCLCQDQICINATQANDCESQEPYMADDGSGSDVTIPSFLVPKHDADTFKAAIKTTPMRVEMEFPPPLAEPIPSTGGDPAPDAPEGGPSIVIADLWFDAADDLSQNFLKGFRPAAMALLPRAQVSPHPYVYDGVASSCQLDGQKQPQEPNNDEPEAEDPWQDQPCYNLCTNGGRYCSTDPDDDWEYGVSGADVVEESLRQICIASGVEEESSLRWWNYVHEFQSQCFSSALFHDERCIQTVMRDSGVDEEAVRSCMEHSGGLTGKEKNNKLEAELELQKSRGIYMLPTLHINGVPYSGPMYSDAVFSAICAEFPYDTKPDICHQCSNCADSMECVVNNGVCPMATILVSPTSSSNVWSTSTSMPPDVVFVESASTVRGGVTHFTFLSSVFVLVALAGLLAAWHRRRAREEMRSQVRGIMADYMPLGGDPNSSTIDFAAGNPMDFAGRGSDSSLLA